MRNLILLATCLVACACGSTPTSQDRPESFAIYITGYEVPTPTNNPYSDQLGQREYLRFYHQAYLTTMWDPWPAWSTISPISDHSQAAIAGHYDGQHDAHRDKRNYWAAHGRNYETVFGRDNQRQSLTDDASDSTMSPIGAEGGVPPRATGN